ncbi:MAG: hypothetical protein K6U08_09990, partial [Firmicutes bacterium]|nr:hypothetical protein [Bacillota bacterium]
MALVPGERAAASPGHWEQVLVDLDRATDLPLDAVGAKAGRLAELRREGFPVLPGFVVPAGTLERCVELAGLGEEWRRAQAAPALYRYQLLRNLVQRLDLPPEFVALLEGRAADLGGALVVRSSGAAEDSPSRSLAGFFHSEVGVAPTDVVHAVRRCWASGFTELVARHGIVAGGLPVLVQPVVRPEKSGVFFSRDPLDRDGDGSWVVEAVRGHLGRLVCGSAVPVRYSARGVRGEGGEGPGLLSEEELALVVATCRRAAEACGWDADVEWALADGRMWVLQARPVTTCSVRPVAARKLPYLVDIDDPEACGREDLGRCHTLHLRWYDKHHWIRVAARRRGFTVAEAGYLFFRPEEVTWEQLEPLVFPGPCVKVSDGSRIRTFGRRLLVPFLKTVPPRLDGVAVVKLEHVSLTEMCGFARRLLDGGTLIEALRGAFGGFRVDRLPFTVYELDSSGRVVRHRPETYTRVWVFDEEKGTFAPREVPPCTADLDPSHLDLIRRMAEAMSEEFGTVTVEWVLEGNRLDLFDLTLESGGLNLARYLAGTISPGKAEGEVVVLRDISRLKEILPSRSVIPEPEYF